MLTASTELLIRPNSTAGESDRSLLVAPEHSGFEYLTFRAQKLAKGESFTDQTGNNELHYRSKLLKLK